MIRVDLGDSRYIRGVAILFVLLLVLFQAVKRGPKDRVLLLQTIAFGLFLLIFFLSILGAMPDGLFPIMAILFCFFVVLAGYFGVLGWIKRRKRPG